ncbi:hypothetical protein PDESU_01695 [Pontiella desulfatans]|uniref:Tandem-95 repeat protein n=1 Tax=Pontiella desulfatans TaxID=2750659 RepID=A0A6C2U0M0_PONDE|nr:Ig-like domain-containing protein [Pontiella desulfatans]VGO13141.1 hypothetical protein PDESU_01695 [Pontiella desulfatans]
MKKGLVACCICLLAGVVQAAIVYQDNFDNDGLGVNTNGVGGGLGNRTIYGTKSWADDGNLQYVTGTGTAHGERALTYSENGFQSAEGFELTVSYLNSSYGNSSKIALGLISTDTDFSTYGGMNPFTESSTYSVGITTDIGDLTFTDGVSSTNLYDGPELPLNADTNVVIRIENDGAGGADWSWSLGGVSQGSGNIAVFDFSKTYHFVAYGRDDAGDKRINSVSLTALGNAVPTADSQSLKVYPDTPQEITLTGHDPEGSTLVYEVVDMPTNGTLDVSSIPDVLYTPTGGYEGPDHFTFTVADGVATSSTATISITVALNDAPVAAAQDLQMQPDTGLDITLSGADEDGPSNLTYIVLSSPVNGTLATNGALPDLIYTPTTGYEGADSFTFSVFDGLSNSTPATISISVTNELPTATAQSVSVLPDGAVDIMLSGSDPDNGPSNLTYTVLSQPVNGSLATNGALPNLTYTPDPGYEGADSFTFSVFDGLTESDAATVSIAVTNYVPNADSQHVAAEAGTNVVITLTGSDPEGSNLVFEVVDYPANGSLDESAMPDVLYTPAEDFIGDDSFTFTVSDGVNVSDAATVFISVLPDGTTVSFMDLNADTVSNTLMVAGSTSNLTVTGVAVSNDYVYSVAYTGADYDGDTANDTVTFDVRVKGWIGSITDAGTEAANTSSDQASAIIGTTNEVVGIAGGDRFSVGGNMADGATLEFMVENMAVSLTDATQVGSAVPAGFYSARLEETSGHSHQTVFGEGTGLLGFDWNGPNLESGTLSVGTGSLYISADAPDPLATSSFSWGVVNVDFNIIVSVANAGVPDLALDVSGSDLVFSWEGSATYDVLTNANLAYPNWGVAVSGAASPVTNAIGSEDQLFFRLSE